MIDIKGKQILVTEIASSLGQAIARTMIEAGANVVGAYDLRDESRLAGISDPAAVAAAFGYDCRQSQAATDLIAQTVKAVGRIDGAIIVPQARPRKAFIEQTPEEFEEGLKELASNMFFVGQAVARQMVAQGGPGRIVYISTVATEMPFHEVSLFATNLAAVNTIARVAALELGQYGITVNVVAPGWLQANDGRTLYFAGTEIENPNADDTAYVAAGVPVGRAGGMAEVAEFCVFLTSDASAYISGAYLPIDGAYAITKTAGNTPFPRGKKWLPYDSGYDPRTSDT